MTMNDTWGYKSYDTNFKSTETLLRNLIDIASKGGNYLLNIGPDSKGIVPAARGRAPSRRSASGWRSTAKPSTDTQPTLFDVPSRHLQPPKRTATASPSSFPPGTGAPPPAQQDLHRDLRLAAKALPLDKMPRKVTGAYLLADKHPQAAQIHPERHGPRRPLPRKGLDPIATSSSSTLAN